MRLFLLPQIVKWSILNATNREATFPKKAVPVNVAKVVEHFPAPGTVNANSGSPPTTVDTDSVERTIVVTIATRKPCKAAGVRSISVGSTP